MGKTPRSATPESWQIINCVISEAQQTAFQTWKDALQKKNGDPALELLGAGYKLSLLFVDTQNAYCVSVTGTRDTPNMGKTITSWSDDVYEAVWLSLYKVSVIFSNGEWVDTKTSKWG